MNWPSLRRPAEILIRGLRQFVFAKQKSVKSLLLGMQNQYMNQNQDQNQNQQTDQQVGQNQNQEQGQNQQLTKKQRYLIRKQRKEQDRIKMAKTRKTKKMLKVVATRTKGCYAYQTPRFLLRLLASWL